MAFLTIRIDDDLKSKLEQVAAKEMRSVSSQALLFIREALFHDLASRETFVVPPKIIKPVKPVKAVKPMEIPYGVTEQTWADFKRLRAAKKAPITTRAIEAINKEAMIAGMSLENALRECCARGWTGFKAEWVRSKQDEVAALLRPSVPTLEM